MKKILKKIGLWAFFAPLLCSQIQALIPNNFVEPTQAFNVRGSSISLLHRKHDKDASLFSAHLTPFTQITKSAYTSSRIEDKVAHRTGTWGMASMGLGLVSNPEETDLNLQTPIYGDKDDFPLLWAVAQDANVAAALPIIIWDNQDDGFFSVGANYEKIGLRGEVSVEPYVGIVLSIQGGVHDYNIDDVKFYNPLESNDTAYDDASTDVIINNFMRMHQRNDILAELGIDTDGDRDIVIEDTTIQMALYYPFEFLDDDDNPYLYVIPRGLVGLAIPAEGINKKTTESKDKAFALPVGNDGFVGGTFEGGVTLDFAHTVNFSVVGGYTIFNTRTLTDQRLPNNQYQNILYPFKQDFSKERGGTWHVSTSLYCDGFVKGMKCFLEYSWIAHRKDKVTLTTAANLPVFKDGITRYEKNSKWRAGVFHAGASYSASENIELGLGFQAVLHGTQVHKPYNFFGSIGFFF